MRDGRKQIRREPGFGGRFIAGWLAAVLATAAGCTPQPPDGDLLETVVPGEPQASHAASELAAPSEATAELVGPITIKLRWLDGNPGQETGFAISQSVNGAAFRPLPASMVPEHDPADPQRRVLILGGLLENRQYCFAIEAFNEAAGFSPAATVCATTGSATSSTVPACSVATPSELTAEAIAPDEIELRWRDNSDNETHFVFEISEDGGLTWTFHGEVATAVFSRDPADPGIVIAYDNERQPGRQYCYRIKARNAQCDSGWSNADCDTTPTDTSPSGGMIEMRLTRGLQSGEWIGEYYTGTYIQLGYKKIVFYRGGACTITDFPPVGVQSTQNGTYRELSYNAALGIGSFEVRVGASVYHAEYSEFNNLSRFQLNNGPPDYQVIEYE